MIFFCCWRSNTASSPGAQCERRLAGSPHDREGRRCDLLSRAAGRSRSAAPPNGRACRRCRGRRAPGGLAVTRDAPESGSALGVDDQPRVHRDPPSLVADTDFALVQVADVVAGEVERRDGRSIRSPPPARRGTPRPGAPAMRLHAHRQVLRDDRDVLAVLREVHRDREDAGVVVAEPDAGGEYRGVGVRQLDAERAALPDLDGKSSVRARCAGRRGGRSACRAKYPISGS